MGSNPESTRRLRTDWCRQSQVRSVSKSTPQYDGPAAFADRSPGSQPLVRVDGEEALALKIDFDRTKTGGSRLDQSRRTFGLADGSGRYQDKRQAHGSAFAPRLW